MIFALGSAMASSTGHGVPLLLLIEGRSTDRPTTHEVLADAQDVLNIEWVGTLNEGVAQLKEHFVSAVLLDLSLPECRDLSAIDELRKALPTVAIMILARYLPRTSIYRRFVLSADIPSGPSLSGAPREFAAAAWPQ